MLFSLITCIGIMCGVFTLYYNHSHSNTYETADIIYFQNRCYVHKFVHIITSNI